MDGLSDSLTTVYYNLNPLFICLVLFVLFVAAEEISFWTRGPKAPETAPVATSDIALVLGGIMTLLALMLGFSFAMSENRFETRRQLVIDEANSIGTTYLRSWTLPEPKGSQLRDSLRRYIALRVEIIRAGKITPDKVRQFDSRAKELHGEMWTRAAAIARNNPTPVTALFLQTLNETIDLHAKRLAAFKNRVPFTIYIVLFLLSFIAMAVLGYYFRAKGSRVRFLSIMIALLVTSVLWLIMDLDQPSRGAIRASQQSLLDLNEDLNKEARPARR